MKNLSDKHKSVHLRVVLPKDLREQLDEVRGNVPASAFVRDLRRSLFIVHAASYIATAGKFPLLH
ncbi:MAG: hypothetical protein QM315_05910 [Bacillota bacterium]|nr:hypothetical protein [Bacillota bacterium]